MEGAGDREDLRFRLEWSEADLDVPAADTDFSFDWEDQRDEGPPVGELPSEDAEEIAEYEPDPYAGLPEPVSVLDDEVDLAATGEVYEVPFYTDAGALEAVRNVLNQHNDALVQISDAVLDLTKNVSLLIDEVRESKSSVAASAMVSLSASVEQLRDDLQGMMDDVVAASGGQRAGGKASQPRIFVELDRVHKELQSLKRRFPVRAREFDVDDVVDRVVEAVLIALNADKPAAPRQLRTPAKRQRPLRAD